MKQLPRHVAIIMDGNGRWAQRRMLPRVAGHHKGVEAARKVVNHCISLKIEVLTLFAFSSENWLRPPSEVSILMTILQNLLMHDVHELHSSNVRLRVIGNIDGLGIKLQDAINTAHKLTQNNTGLKLNIALNYGGRWDIVQAAKQLCNSVVQGKLAIEQINEELFGKYVCLNDLPEPDLLIRSSGEQRISNFLLWQLAYTEIYFTDTLWPDFTAKHLDLAIEFFAGRERRFGKVQEVINV